MFLAYRYLTASSDVAEVEHGEQSKMLSLKESDSGSIPAGVLSKVNDVTVLEKTATFSVNGHSVSVHYKETLPSAGGSVEHSVFFMHGASFSSKTWQDIKTLQLVAAMGYRAVAVDIPGFGKSKNAHYDNERSFVEQFVKGVKLDRPVLICASMSGSFALPFVLRPEAATCTQRLRGFVPIAPVGTSAFSQADYKSCKVPTMIVYGERDTGAPVDTLRQMPNSRVSMIKNAGHACYMNDTDAWHRLLYNFLHSPDVFGD